MLKTYRAHFLVSNGGIQDHAITRVVYFECDNLVPVKVKIDMALDLAPDLSMFPLVEIEDATTTTQKDNERIDYLTKRLTDAEIEKKQLNAELWDYKMKARLQAAEIEGLKDKNPHSIHKLMQGAKESQNDHIPPEDQEWAKGMDSICEGRKTTRFQAELTKGEGATKWDEMAKESDSKSRVTIEPMPLKIGDVVMEKEGGKRRMIIEEIDGPLVTVSYTTKKGRIKYAKWFSHNYLEKV